MVFGNLLCGFVGLVEVSAGPECVSPALVLCGGHGVFSRVGSVGGIMEPRRQTRGGDAVGVAMLVAFGYGFLALAAFIIHAIYELVK